MRPQGTFRKVIVVLLAALACAACSGDNDSAENSPSDQETRDNLTKLQSLGYLSGYNKPSGESKVVAGDPGKIHPGLTLFTSGHTTVALLMDLEGNTVHQWNAPFEKIWTEPLGFDFTEGNSGFIRRAHVFPNGDLLVIFDYVGIAKLDRDSHVLWSRAGQHHHDLKVLDDGTIVTLRRVEKSADQIREVMGDMPVRGVAGSDAIVFLTADGVETDRIDLMDAMARSDHDSLLGLAENSRDLFHANSVSVVAGAGNDGKEMFHPGDIVVSMRNISTVVVVDATTKTVKWALSGQSLLQHQAEHLANGNIMLLDNRGGSGIDDDFDKSQVIEVDPATKTVVWRYRGTADRPFFTHRLGYNQRLPNGNTLITESTQGRMLEITQTGEIVWEYVSPYRTGDNGELIATLMGGQRIKVDSLPFLAESR